MCGWRWRLLLLCILSFLWVASAHAYLVRGTPKCVNWTADPEEKSWVMGYISGRNAALDGAFTDGKNMAEVYEFVGAFCRANRDKDADDALQRYARAGEENPGNAPATSRYQQLPWLDLRLDVASLSGKQVQTRARLTAFGGMVMLSDPEKRFDGNGLPAEQETLSREDRAFVLQNCGSGCLVGVQGEVGEVMFQPGLILHRLIR